jgi:NifU-like protein involved in Fe-S cluster formation
MDELVIKYYRRLLREGFRHTGTLENPAIFLDTVGEKVRICGNVSRNFLHLYIDVSHDSISDIRYKCMCDPIANVVVEIMCDLVAGKTLEEAIAINEESFVGVLGSRGEEFLKRTRGIIELLNRGIDRYRSAAQAG